MSTPARIAHQIDGRLRIEVATQRGNVAWFARLARQLAQAAYVQRARANPQAACIVIDYTGPLERLLTALGQAALSLPGLPPAARPAAPATGDPMLLAALLFGAVGLVQAARGDIMLPALSAFWYAASALRLAHLSADTTSTAARQALPLP